MPSIAGTKIPPPPTAKIKPSFQTLIREHSFQYPSPNKSEFPALQEAVQPHVDSFNAITADNLLEIAVKDIGKKTVFDHKSDDNGGRGNRLSFWLEDIQLSRPTLSSRERTSLNRRLYPAESRERKTTYKGILRAKFNFQLNDGPVQTDIRELGEIPIMVKSNRCHLENLSPAELIERKEESLEMGGYFIVNGNEKIIRLLNVPKRNHPLALVRSSFTKRGSTYTNFGVQIRCARRDQTTLTNILHYLNDGNVMLRFSWRKTEYLVPVMMILNALVETNDKVIFDGITAGRGEEAFLAERVEGLLRTYKNYHLYTQQDTLAYLGDKFRVVLDESEDLKDEEAGRAFLKKIILVHLTSNQDKFRLLIFMIRKLYALVAGDCSPDNPDSTQHHEILLGGFLYLQILKERLDDYLTGIRNLIQSDLNAEARKLPKAKPVNFHDKKLFSQVMQKFHFDLGHKMTYFLATGNLNSVSGLDLQQITGYTIVAEKLNFLRYLSHFRAVHRGSFFQSLRTTTVRKLLPESWGFICPVHTPDGAPCGLLNHLSHKCKITTAALDVSGLPELILSLGVSPASITPSARQTSCVQLDGRIIGWCTDALAHHVSEVLRLWKVTGEEKVPLNLEIAYVPTSNGGQYPGLYIFSTQARMTRPVIHLATGKEDWVGPFEQVYMSIAVKEEEILEGESTHMEFHPTNILSIVANLTPFSDFNPSPRNMYQCQMGKQTMGTPGTAIAYRTDSKMYRLQTGQTPIVRPRLYDEYGMDHYPMGTNAIVAVISYTGYDMDDAVILNKSSHERGFAYGTIYKTEVVDLKEKKKPGDRGIYHHFGFGPQITTSFTDRLRDKIDDDGFPFVGALLSEGDPMAVYWDEITGRTMIEQYHGPEDAFVDEVRILGNDIGDQECQQISVKLRITRAPVIGDKFSSRHGQKGVCSQKWPDVDMPFSESGIRPDVIINPHAFPSRMTIGMFVESLAGKVGALEGRSQDATPFRFSEENTAADYFGEQLRKAGYNYHGNEPMYSGTLGVEFNADVYIGCVFYQRLRHMVNDKFQVRTTGPVHSLTQQPIKGRKRAGGIRFGEMERDSMIAHGTSFLLKDRLMNCSDYTQSWICRDCGSVLSPLSAISGTGGPGAVRCKSCAVLAEGFETHGEVWLDGSGTGWKGGENVAVVALPHVFKYLAAELACMSIKLSCKTRS